jgi:hypothetical protein
MRLCLALLASLSLVACGGGDDADRPDAGPRPDARIDAVAAPNCLFGTEYGLSLGTEKDPAAFDGSFGQDDAGNWIVAVYGSLNMLPEEPAEFGNHGLTIYMQDNTGLFLDTPFGTVPLNEELAINGTANDDLCGACMEGYAGHPTAQPPNSTTNIPTQIYLADAGNITFTQFDAPVDDGTTVSRIAAEYTGVALTGYDFAPPNEALDPACTIAVDLSMVFDVTFSSAPGFVSSGKPTPLVASQPINVTRK